MFTQYALLNIFIRIRVLYLNVTDNLSSGGIELSKIVFLFAIYALQVITIQIKIILIFHINTCHEYDNNNNFTCQFIKL